MTSKQTISAPNDAMFKQAADWATRAESGRFGSEDFSALKDWLEADRRHLLAFKRMQDLLDRSEGAQYSALPIVPTVRTRGRQVVRQTLKWLPIAAALAFVALTATITLPVAEFTVETGLGEIREISLRDGSTVTLRGNSRLRVNYGWKQRVIDMQRGEAAFEVASHFYKPFVVRSNSIQVVAVGTVFNVAVMGNESAVTLIEGRVDVGAADAPIPDSRLSCRAVRLKVGQKVAYRQDGSRSEVEQVDISQVTAWQDSRIVLQRRPLAELVDELNRTFPVSITVADPALAAMTVNVSMNVDQQDVTLHRLEQQLPISFNKHSDGGIVVMPRASASPGDPDQ